MIYPVGSIYISVNNTNPASFIGGTWALMPDRFLIGAGNAYSVGATGGESAHTLTVSEMPSHQHNTNDRMQWTNQAGQGQGTTGYSSNTCLRIDLNDVYTSHVGGGQAHNNMPPYIVTRRNKVPIYCSFTSD